MTLSPLLTRQDPKSGTTTQQHACQHDLVNTPAANDACVLCGYWTCRCGR
jgi:hypothetical protein